MNAQERLFELILPDLRRIALFRLKSTHPIVRMDFDALDLITHAYIKLLFGDKQVVFENKNHLLARFSQEMRNILVDHSRMRLSEKRGGQHHHIYPGDAEYVSIEDVPAFTPAPEPALIAIREALDDLARHDKKLVKIVELLCFDGYTVHQTANILGISTDTVKRRWKKAKMYLLNILTDAKGGGGGSATMKRD